MDMEPRRAQELLMRGLARFAATIFTIAKELHVMAGDFEVVILGQLMLDSLKSGVVEFPDPTACQADDMVVMGVVRGALIPAHALTKVLFTDYVQLAEEFEGAVDSSHPDFRVGGFHNGVNIIRAQMAVWIG